MFTTVNYDMEILILKHYAYCANNQWKFSERPSDGRVEVRTDRPSSLTNTRSGRLVPEEALETVTAAVTVLHDESPFPPSARRFLGAVHVSGPQ